MALSPAANDSLNFRTPDMPHLSATLRVDARCKAFEAAWLEAARRGTTPPEMLPFLDGVSGGELAELLKELLLLDLDFRRVNHRNRTRAQYVAELPGHEALFDQIVRQYADEPAVEAGPISVSQSTSLSLLERVKARDQDACTGLVELYGPLVYSWARRGGLSQEDAADMVQEVFRSVFEHVGEFRKSRPEDTFHGWLWTISKNKLRDHFRRRERHAEGIGGTDAQRQWEQIPDREPAESDASSGLIAQRRRLEEVLDRIRGEFTAPTWEAFCLATFEERTSPEIAARLGLTANAVRHAKARVLRRLREELRDLID
jgi:RNA polymerase sigma-70 factor (ECF subfamily)